MRNIFIDLGRLADKLICYFWHRSYWQITFRGHFGRTFHCPACNRRWETDLYGAFPFERNGEVVQEIRLKTFGEDDPSRAAFKKLREHQARQGQTSDR